MTEFITRNHGQKEFEVIIKTDNKDHYKATEDFARKLIDHAKPQTNADRIRAMSDEELVELLANISENGEYEFFCDNPKRMIACDNCKRCVKEWLKQPADIGGNS